MGGRKKPWLELRGEPLLLHTLRCFLGHGSVSAVRVALAVDDAVDPPEWLSALDRRLEVVAGGPTRAESVREAVRALPSEVDVILVHDAARPFVAQEILDRCIEGALAGHGAVAGWPASDTLKEVDSENRVVRTLDRSRVWLAQTPQGFPAAMLRDAYEGLDDPAAVTDDASVIERAGGRVVMVRGGARNVKVTTPDDLPLAEFMAGSRGSAETVTEP